MEAVYTAWDEDLGKEESEVVRPFLSERAWFIGQLRNIIET